MRWLPAIWGAISLLIAAELVLRARYRSRVLPSAPPEPGRVTIVALGDSITAGWPGPPDQAWPALIGVQLESAYPDVAWRLINAGAPGDTAPMGYARFDREVAAHAPAAVLIAFGLNDCQRARRALDRWFEARVPVGPERSYLWRAVQARVARIGRQLGWFADPVPEPTPMPFARTSPAGFSAALSALIDRSLAVRGQPILLTMTPISEQAPPEARVLLEAYAAYNARIRTMASQQGTLLVELTEHAPDGAFTADGIHLTATGQQWAADRIFAALEAARLWTALARRAG